ANEEPDSFLSRGLEKTTDQSDLEYCESTDRNNDDDSDSKNPIRHINSVNTPANEIDEKKPELKNLPQHLEYAYLHGDKSFPVIVSSKLSEKEKMSLLQVLDKRKGAIAWKMLDIKGIRFFQIPIASEDQEKTTFTCPYRNFAYRRMPFGLCNAPATFQRCMTTIFHDMVEDIMEVFMDEFSVFVYTDHSALKYLFSKQDAKPRLIRWVLLLQGFYIEIKDKKGVENLAADHLLRLENPNLGTFTEEEITDEFPDEHLMILKVELNSNEPWYADYVNYIVGKIVPLNWTPKKRIRFFSQVKNYFWDEPYAFKLCSDNVMRRCVAGNEIYEILAHCHSGPTGGHHSASVIIPEEVRRWLK
ncbi:reverse transcriptase domain-containing protein, partial [Tanacetum coccineum]